MELTEVVDVASPQIARERGLKFGYPECCIDHYITMAQADSKYVSHDMEATVTERRIGLGGTGFHPCLDCQTRTLLDLYNEITTRRQIDSPFPIADSDVWHGRTQEEILPVYSRALTFRKRLVKLEGARVVEHALDVAISSLRFRASRKRRDASFDTILGEKVYVLPGQGNYLVFSMTSFHTAVSHYESIVGRRYQQGHYPSTFPSVVEIAERPETISVGGTPQKICWIDCTGVQHWIDTAVGTPEMAECVVEYLREVGHERSIIHIQKPTVIGPRYPNLEILGLNQITQSQRYLVRSQAGYRKALRDFMEDVRSDDSREVVDRRKHYGTYPAVVEFHYSRDEYDFTYWHRWQTIEVFEKEIVEMQRIVQKLEKRS